MKDYMPKYLAMVAQSRLLAPNLKEATLHVFSSTIKSNRVAREVVRNHLLALRWMNPAAQIYLRETRGEGTSQIRYTLHSGEKKSFLIKSNYSAELVVGKLLMAARDPAEVDEEAVSEDAAPAAGVKLGPGVKEVLQ